MMSCDDMSMSIFSRPDSAVHLTPLFFIFGVPLNMLQNRVGCAISNTKQFIDRYGHTLTTQANTKEGHRTSFHNSIIFQLCHIFKEAALNVETEHNMALFESLSPPEYHALESHASRIVPDIVLDMSDAREKLLRPGETALDTRILIDVKTIGYSNQFKISTHKLHATHHTRADQLLRPCQGVNDRGTSVHHEYLKKAKQCDRALYPDGTPNPAPISRKLLKFGRVYGVALGPHGEISRDLRILLEPAIERIAERRRQRMTLYNLSEDQTKAAVYDAIRKRLGMLAHSTWHSIMLRSLRLASHNVIGNFDTEEALGGAFDDPSFTVAGELGL